MADSAPCPANAVPGPCAKYTRRSTNFTYYYNTSATDFYSAEQACMDNGGHLASFTSDQEQKCAAAEKAAVLVLNLGLLMHCQRWLL
jgi:hypothetical protein